jgi:hypothetical protein
VRAVGEIRATPAPGGASADSAGPLLTRFTADPAAVRDLAKAVAEAQKAVEAVQGDGK